ncbi:MAG TPA: exodeoxyribonuclease VII large subunit [Deltaproteobacteria bacterium]|nr:exodeoxyribonuclease VII large subunit [Deltaproteobacteria bacterium]
MTETLKQSPTQSILTVTELTREIKSILEKQYPSVWVSGEVSNFHRHSSGHFYFTLKDSHAQISAVMFRGTNQRLRFQLENGMEVVANGQLSVYEARGNYQIILEYLEPRGLGALQLAFTQLLQRLAEEGLFEETRKRPLPFLPRTVGIVTSPTGAVIQDMLRILRRRNPHVNILLYPVSVQGETAAEEIVRGIAALNAQGEAEVLIVGRGGGSLEDLWAFNTEAVARAIFASNLPVISAVGHETDVTISDYVADLRAPTPSAAAELAAPVASEVRQDLEERRWQLHRALQQNLDRKRGALKFWISHLKHPKKRLEELSQHLDDLAAQFILEMQRSLEEKRARLRLLAEKLEVLSPLSILARGYSIVQILDRQGEKKAVLKDASKVRAGDLLSLQLMKGTLKAEVKSY